MHTTRKSFHTTKKSLHTILRQYRITGRPSKEKLQQESALIDQVVAKHLQQKKETGETQEATEIRDNAPDKLAHWISDLRAVAKVALEDNPQQLEKIGILARTR